MPKKKPATQRDSRANHSNTQHTTSPSPSGAVGSPPAPKHDHPCSASPPTTTTPVAAAAVAPIWSPLHLKLMPRAIEIELEPPLVRAIVIIEAQLRAPSSSSSARRGASSTRTCATAHGISSGGEATRSPYTAMLLLSLRMRRRLCCWRRRGWCGGCRIPLELGPGKTTRSGGARREPLRCTGACRSELVALPLFRTHARFLVASVLLPPSRAPGLDRP